MKKDTKATDAQAAYAIFRITLGINILIHGAVRIGGAGPRGFASSTSATFASTILPSGLAYLFLLVLPFVEALLGALITLGLFSRWAFASGGLVIAVLTFGTALRSDWPTVGIQMIYSIAYYILLSHRCRNQFSIDALIIRSKAQLSENIRA